MAAVLNPSRFNQCYRHVAHLESRHVFEQHQQSFCECRPWKVIAELFLNSGGQIANLVSIERWKIAVVLGVVHAKTIRCSSNSFNAPEITVGCATLSESPSRLLKYFQRGVRKKLLTAEEVLQAARVTRVRGGTTPESGFQALRKTVFQQPASVGRISGQRLCAQMRGVLKMLLIVCSTKVCGRKKLAF